MSPTVEDIVALEELESKIRALLPEQYQDAYEDVLPVSMGSAGLKYDPEGRVAWNEIWATFCDLAMAGGPPHRGTLLEPANTGDNNPAENEIARGIRMVTGLEVRQPSVDGWLAVQCHSVNMAGWLVRAIVMENISARHDGDVLFLPVGPEFRLAKEIKNVITSIAKTCHYWNEHMPAEQQEALHLSELVEPERMAHVRTNPETYRTLLANMASEITRRTARTCFPNRYVGWIGVELPDDRAAIWVMRAMVAENILARREGCVLFLPVSHESERVLDTFERFHRLQTFTRH